MAYEILYFVFMLGAAKYCIDNKKKRSVRSLITSIYGWKKDDAAEGGVVPDQERKHDRPLPEHSGHRNC